MLRFDYPPRPDSEYSDSEWSGQKTMWIVARGAGRVLVRGRRLDGPEQVRFEHGTLPRLERRLPRAGRHPSMTRLRAPGCYGYQVDGSRFSYVVVFEARLSSGI